MESSDPDGDLIGLASQGDESAVGHLLARHRDRLRRMVAVHLDTRLSARVDPSDVVQEAMAEAIQKLPAYLRARPIAFYPWLRQIAWQRLVQLRHHHLGVQKRSLLREEHWGSNLSDESAMELANRFVDTGTNPHQRAVRHEMLIRAHKALETLSPQDRQVLILRYLEQLSTAEAAQVLGISLDAFSKRHVRAIQRIRDLLGGLLEGSS